MAETLSVLFKIGRLAHMTKPEPAAIEKALHGFLHETISAADLAHELGIPSDTAVRYEIQWRDDLVEDPKSIPVHMSIYGPRLFTVPLHNKLKAGLVDGGWAYSGRNLAELGAALGIPPQHSVQFKLYVRSPTGEKFET